MGMPVRSVEIEMGQANLNLLSMRLTVSIADMAIMFRAMAKRYVIERGCWRRS